MSPCLLFEGLYEIPEVSFGAGGVGGLSMANRQAAKYLSPRSSQHESGTSLADTPRHYPRPKCIDHCAEPSAPLTRGSMSAKCTEAPQSRQNSSIRSLKRFGILIFT